MKLNTLRTLGFALLLCTFSSSAGVFKCLLQTGKVVYQSEPCSTGVVSEGVVNVPQQTPEQAEESRSKLEAFRQRQAEEELEKSEAEMRQQEENERQESLELQRRSVIAQERQLQTERQRLQEERDREMSQQRYRQIYQPYFGQPYPPGPNFDPNWNWRNPNQPSWQNFPPMSQEPMPQQLPPPHLQPKQLVPSGGASVQQNFDGKKR